jgi:uroporphyrin-III C-methyltransferase / precorrin-2 dehydrogenase / sirohydrochlorin ferrochelatase
MPDNSAYTKGSVDAAKPGRVILVGAGPGDPDLLTVRAVREIAAADVVFADRLVGKGVLKLIPDSAEIVHVGKSKGEHSVPQSEIHRRMIETALAGRRVVRLKGGDPFIFGRGGEELEALRAAGVEVDVVPGISSALGCAATSQIPLTHRDIAQTVTFVTGHAALGAEPDLDWNALARPNQTVVVFMGLGNADAIAARLIAAGRSAATPVAVIENGTRENEISAFGALGDITSVIQSAGIQGPALLVIGEVVALAKESASTAHPRESRDPGRNEKLVPVSSFNSEHASPTELDPGFRQDERGLLKPNARPSLSALWRMFS